MGRGALAEFSFPDDHPFKDDPEMALVLGYCLSEWDHIEHAMVLIFAGLLDTDYFKAERVFWSQHGLAGRSRMILELCKRPGLIDKEDHEAITSYINRIRTLSGARNMLVHGVWFKDQKTGRLFRSKVQPDMLWQMMDENSKFFKEDIIKIGEEFAALRSEFLPFALKYSGDKLRKMVAEKMAVAEAQNPGSTIRLGRQGKAARAAEPEDTPASLPAEPAPG